MISVNLDYVLLTPQLTLESQDASIEFQHSVPFRLTYVFKADCRLQLHIFIENAEDRRIQERPLTPRRKMGISSLFRF
jgi:hypothetical protein